jgi:hypothetical protein
MKAASLLSPLCKFAGVPVPDLTAVNADGSSFFDCPRPRQIHAPWNWHRILVGHTATESRRLSSI